MQGRNSKLKKSIKKILPFVLFLIVFFVVISGLLNFYIIGQPDPVSAEQISDTLISHELQPVDITGHAKRNFPEGTLNKCVVSQQGDIRFEFYDFVNQSNALMLYREARKLIITTKMATPRTEIETGKANYKYYSLTADGNYSVTVYVKNTAIYAYCNEENLLTVTSILDDIDYIKTEAKRETPEWVLAIVRVFQYALFIPAALISRSFYWKAAYKSAGVTISQIDKLKETRRELSVWLLEISPKQKITKIILTIYKYYLIPEYLCLVLAFIGFFTSSLDKILNNILGFIIIAIIFVFGALGVALNKKCNQGL